ncbi:alpha/beta hydrolase [Candidatus Dojkabacteria bacterium]|nr:alpha/beta hydrolase [Candidatus Dojkabacteria bacterium]
MFTKASGLKIEYSKTGKGGNVLLLHGWGGNIESLSPLQEILSKKGFSVVNISLPGFGKSETPHKPWTLKDYAVFLEELILMLRLKRPILIGHSFGGKISTRFVLEFPNMISRLILINASGIKPKNNLKKNVLAVATEIFKVFASIFPAKSRERIKNFYYRYVVRETDYLKSEGLKETFKKVINEHFDQELKLIKVPTFIIWSEKDTYVPLWMGVKMRNLIPNSKLEMVENETHGLPLQKPKFTADLIDKYLQENPD